MATTTLLSVEEFEALRLDDDRYELWWGEVRPVPGGGMEHSGIGLSIGVGLRAFVRQRGLGFVVGADCRFVLSRELRLILVPDAAFVASARVPTGEALRRSFEGAPDLAVEVVSPTDRSTDVDDKVRTWLRFGARMVWIFNPRRLTVAVWTPDGNVRTLGADEVLDGGDVLPGFRVPVAELFA